MGQAKLRGTYEERKARAVAIRQAEQAEQRRLYYERKKIEDQEADMREAAMTPAERRRKRESVTAMMGIYAMGLAMMSNMRGYR